MAAISLMHTGNQYLQFKFCILCVVSWSLMSVSLSWTFSGGIIFPQSTWWVRSRTDYTRCQPMLAAVVVGRSRLKSPHCSTLKTAMNWYFVLLHQFSTTACVRFSLLGVKGPNPIQDPKENKHIQYVCDGNWKTRQWSGVPILSPSWTFLGKLWCCWVDTLSICQITVIVFPIPAVTFS